MLIESWCGYTALVLPVMHTFESATPTLNLRNTPKDLTVIGVWGRARRGLMKIFAAYREEHNAIRAELQDSLQLWGN